MCLLSHTRVREPARKKHREKEGERERGEQPNRGERVARHTHGAREDRRPLCQDSARTYVRTEITYFQTESEWVRWNRMKEEPRTGASPGPPASWSIETRRSTGHVHVCTRFLVLFFVSLFRDESRFVALTAGGVGEAIGEVVEILELFEIEKKERIGGERIELFDGNLWNYIIWIFADFWILCVNIVRRDREFRGLYGKFGG